jgi:tetratricopeptide (TPR) repeat protein
MSANKDDAPLPAKPSEPDFMKRFEGTVKAYADAVEAGDDDTASQAAMAVLVQAGMEAIANPTPEILLRQEAERCEQSSDWAGAEAAYRKVLALNEAEDNPRLAVKPHMDLSRLFRLTGRPDEAWTHACTASELGRRSDMFTLLAMALDNEAACALERGDGQRAFAAASEALNCMEPGRIFDLMRARALTRRAECFLARSDSESADRDLKRSWELLHSRKQFGIGSVAAMAHWWEVQAKLHQTKGDNADASRALAEAVNYRKQILESCESPNPYAAAALLRVQDKLAELASGS